MTTNFESVERMYAESFERNGDSPASMLYPKDRSALRFRAVLPFLGRSGVRILDYGCGLGYLYDFLSKTAEHEVSYTGVDMLPEFVLACKAKYPDVDFRHGGPNETVSGEFDVVFASGVFNLASHTTPDESREYCFERVQYLHSLAREVLVCDFLSEYVDWKQQGAQHFAVSEVVQFCVERLGRRFQLRHDLLPYEMTLVAWKDSSIRVPENTYTVDS